MKKQSIYKTLVTGTLITSMAIASFTGCGNASSATSSSQSVTKTAQGTSDDSELLMSQSSSESSGYQASKATESEWSKKTESAKENSAKTDVAKTGDQKDISAPFAGGSAMTMTEADVVEGDFVLIYNPLIYDESWAYGWPDNDTLSTGDLGSQIVTGVSRAGGLSDRSYPEMIAQNEFDPAVAEDEVNREGGKAGTLPKVYKKGDKETFGIFNNNMNGRIRAKFTCKYVGDHCYIWYLNGEDIDAAAAQKLGSEFDNQIYETDTRAFGPGRFTEDIGGKVHILCYPMPTGVGGFFYLYDIFASGEVTDEDIEIAVLNVDKAIININSDFFKTNLAFSTSTLAHEFQHQICASDLFYYSQTPMMKTWLNEAMSAFAEELNYPGIKLEGYYNECLYVSDNFRTGQSLYNFSTALDPYIGAYGAVYLFEEYLREMTGDEVFFNIHEYWRTSCSPDVTEAEAIYESVDSRTLQRIKNNYQYNDTLEELCGDAYSIWLSKLTLDFFLRTAGDMEFAHLTEYGNLPQLLMLYSEMEPVDIEGGGRIIVATKNGSYEIPEDADDGLIYIGLDEYFRPITNLIVYGFPVIENDGLLAEAEDGSWTLLNNGLLTIQNDAAFDRNTAGEMAWEMYADSIRTIHIMQGVTSIPDLAFQECFWLESVSISDSITCIGKQAFSYDKRLTTITIPDSVKTIGSAAFYGCKKLKTVNLGSGVTEFGSADCFGKCTSLTDIYYKGSPEQWESFGQTFDTIVLIHFVK